MVKKKTTSFYVIFLLLLWLIFTVFFVSGQTYSSLSSSSYNTSDQQLEKKRKELLDIQKNIGDKKKKLKDLEKKEATLATSLELLSTQIETTELELKEINTQLESIELEMKDIQEQMVEKEEELEKQEELLRYVIRTIYKEGNFSFIESIATSDSLSDSLTQLGYLDVIKNRRKTIIEEIKTLQALLQKSKTELEQKKEESEDIKRKMEMKKIQLEMESVTKNKLIQDTRQLESMYQEAIIKEEQARRQYENDIAAMEKEIARQRADALKKAKEGNGQVSNVYTEIRSTGKFRKPVDSSNITQGFKEPYPAYMFKLYPNLNKEHTGIDYGVPTGTTLYAPDNAVVSLVKFSDYGYGNHLVLYHGNDLYSIYGHLSTISVEKGQKVNKGQIIGKTGNSGTSSGPHLHWEVRQYFENNKGERVYTLKNPLSYL